MGVSGGSSSSKPVDMTPNAFQALQVPFANVIASLLGVSPTPGANYNPSAGTGNPVGAAGSAGSAGTGGQTGQGGVGFIGGDTDNTNHPSAPNTAYGPGNLGSGGGTTGAGTGTGTGAGGTGTNNQPPFTNANDVLNGIPTYGGQTTAPITAPEQALLTQLQGGTGNQPYLANETAGNYLNSAPQVGANASTYGTTAGTSDPYSGLGLNQGVSNPLLQAYITAAQRPTLQNLTETLTRDLPGRFTAAGQMVQPGGSSAFDRAAAIASRGASDAIGDIATNIGYQGFNSQQALEEQAINEQQNRLQSTAAGNQQAGLASDTANQNAYESERQLQQGAAGLNQSELQATISNLQAQALPRLIQQYGLDAGLQQFNSQVNNLMTLLQTAGGVTHPVVGNSSSSSQMGLNLK